jgi:hypothetical protein
MVSIMPKPLIHWLHVFNQPSKDLTSDLDQHVQDIVPEARPDLTTRNTLEYLTRQKAYNDFPLNVYNNNEDMPPPAPATAKDLNHNALRTLELFSIYAAYPSPHALGSAYSRLSEKRWPHFANEVQRAIKQFYKSEKPHSSFSVVYILACIKIEINNKPINPEGDFATILKVIKIKTGVDYAAINATAIVPSIYWMIKFDECTKNQNPHESSIAPDLSSNNAWKCLELLAEYAGFYKHSVVGLETAWGGQIHRFFTGHWNNHHGNDIQRAIGCYYEMDTIEANDNSFHSTSIILGNVKRELGDKPMNPNGDLAKILAVIKLKTGVDYHTLDMAAVQRRTHSLA